MGIVAGAMYGVLGVALVGSGVGLYARRSMDAVPLYDPETASNPASLAGVLGLSLAVFGVVTLAFAALEALDRATDVVVLSYALVVLTVALATAARSRRYE